MQASEYRRVNLSSSLITNEEQDPKRESSILSIKFKVRKYLVQNARIDIRCEASIFNTYHRSKTVQVFVKTPASAENLATHNQEYSSKAEVSGSKALILYHLILLALLTLILA